MSQVTRIDIPAAERAIKNLERIADEIASTAAGAKVTITAMHGCWGNDEFGDSFSKNYVPGAEQMLNNSDSAVQTLRDMAKNLRDTVRMFEEKDTDGALELQ